MQMDMTTPPFVMEKWAKKFGSVYKINLAGVDHVVVTGTDAIYEVLVTRGTDTANRDLHDKFRQRMWTMDYSEMVFAPFGGNQTQWRKTVMKGLKQHNLAYIEQITLEIVDDLLKDFESHGGKPFDPSEYIYPCLFQFLYLLIFGKKAELSDPDLKKLRRVDELFIAILSFVGDGPLLDMFPWLRFFGNKTYKMCLESNEIARNLLAGWKKQAENGELLEDCWFNQLLDTQKENPDVWSDDNVTMNIMSFMGGGSATTSNTLLMFLNLLAHYPEVQTALQKEVDSVIGDARSLAFKDRDNMPYTYACLLETLR